MHAVNLRLKKKKSALQQPCYKGRKEGDTQESIDQRLFKRWSHWSHVALIQIPIQTNRKKICFEIIVAI